MSLVPLQSPSFGARFLSNIMGEPTFNFSLNGGKPEGSNEFKNSHGYAFVVVYASSSNTLSAAKYLKISPQY